MKTVTTIREQLAKIMEYPDVKPIVMVNLLRFRKMTEKGEKGPDVYKRYMKKTAAKLEKAGGKLIWAGASQQVFIGGEEKGWDWILLVQYPSRTAFLGMISDPEFAELSKERESALEDSVLMECDPFL